MKNKLIRLTESDLHRIVKESVNRVLKESRYDSGYEDGQFFCQTRVEELGQDAAKEEIEKQFRIIEDSLENARESGRGKDPFLDGQADALGDWLLQSMGAEKPFFKR